MSFFLPLVLYYANAYEHSIIVQACCDGGITFWPKRFRVTPASDYIAYVQQRNHPIYVGGIPLEFYNIVT